MISAKLCTRDAGSVTQSCKHIAGWQPHVCACAFAFNCDVCKNLFYIGMSINYCWIRKWYGHGRKVIERLHDRHKQCLRDRGEPALLHQFDSEFPGPGLLHVYEVAGATVVTVGSNVHTFVFATRRHFSKRPSRFIC